MKLWKTSEKRQVEKEIERKFKQLIDDEQLGIDTQELEGQLRNDINLLDALNSAEAKKEKKMYVSGDALLTAAVTVLGMMWIIRTEKDGIIIPQKPMGFLERRTRV